MEDNLELGGLDDLDEVIEKHIKKNPDMELED